MKKKKKRKEGSRGEGKKVWLLVEIGKGGKKNFLFGLTYFRFSD